MRISSASSSGFFCIFSHYKYHVDLICGSYCHTLCSSVTCCFSKQTSDPKPCITVCWISCRLVGELDVRQKMPRTIYGQTLTACGGFCFHSMFEAHYFLQSWLSSLATWIVGLRRPVAANQPDNWKLLPDGTYICIYIYRYIYSYWI